MIKKIILVLTTLAIGLQFSFAAIKLDRTRIIFAGNQKSVSINISNENDQYPFLAQAWIETQEGEKLKKYLIALPPVQRLEPNSKSIIRIEKLADSDLLPQDRESVFYFSLREIPPKSDKENVLQLALQTKVKLFYRPKNILPKENDFWQEKLQLKSQNSQLEIYNPTPYYIVILALIDRTSQDLKQGKLIKNFESVMLAPFERTQVKANPKRIGLVFIDDYGGRPEVIFDCKQSDTVCQSTGRVAQ